MTSSAPDREWRSFAKLAAHCVISVAPRALYDFEFPHDFVIKSILV